MIHLGHPGGECRRPILKVGVGIMVGIHLPMFKMLTLIK
jgi:hypothetical protein